MDALEASMTAPSVPLGLGAENVAAEGAAAGRRDRERCSREHRSRKRRGRERHGRVRCNTERHGSKAAAAAENAAAENNAAENAAAANTAAVNAAAENAVECRSGPLWVHCGPTVDPSKPCADNPTTMLALQETGPIWLWARGQPLFKNLGLVQAQMYSTYPNN